MKRLQSLVAVASVTPSFVTGCRIKAPAPDLFCGRSGATVLFKTGSPSLQHIHQRQTPTSRYLVKV